MISKNLLLGVCLVLGAGVIWYATNQQTANPQIQATNTAPPSPQIAPAQTADNGVARPAIEPLTVGREQETELLSAKQQAREAELLMQERQAQALLAQQAKAHQSAVDKSVVEAAEQEAAAQKRAAARGEDISQTTTELTVETRPESIAAAKAEQERLDREKAQREKVAREKAEREKAEKEKLAREKAQREKAEREQAQREKAEREKAQQAKANTVKAEQAPKTAPKNDTKQDQHKVVRGDTLTRLSRQYGVPVSALAEANNMGRDDPLPAGKTIKIPSKAQVARLEREAKEREAQQRAAASADKRLREARQKDSENTGKARYGVQVSLADNQAKADELAKKYRDAGYKVSTSPTSRGVRVLVGSEKSQDAATALRDKIRNDSRVNGKDAWVKRIQ